MPTGSNPGGQNPIIAILRAAFSQIGVPYVFGSEDPGTAFDCSGFTSWALGKVGVSLPHQSTAQSNLLPSVGRSGLRPGDLVFFSYGRLGAGAVDHVGIFLGNGLMIDASSSSHPIEIGPVDWTHFVKGGNVYSQLPTATVPSQDRLKVLADNAGVTNDWAAAYAKNPAASSAARAGGKMGDVAAGTLAGILRGFGLAPKLFDNLIHDAIVGQWTPQQFEAELYGSGEFHDAFPGIFNPDGSLQMSPAEYLRLAYGDGGYVDIGREFGIKLDRERIGALIAGRKSPAEWAFDAQVLQQAKQTEVFRQSFNAVLQAKGKDPLSKGDWFDFIAGRSQRQVEDLYQASSLVAGEGLSVSPSEAIAAAKQIGQPGETVDLRQLVSEVNAIKDFAGPELAAAGITDADLAVLQAGADPRNLRGALEQIVANRKALVGAGLGGGGAATFPTVREGL